MRPVLPPPLLLYTDWRMLVGRKAGALAPPRPAATATARRGPACRTRAIRTMLSRLPTPLPLPRRIDRRRWCCCCVWPGPGGPGTLIGVWVTHCGGTWLQHTHTQPAPPYRCCVRPAAWVDDGCSLGGWEPAAGAPSSTCEWHVRSNWAVNHVRIDRNRVVISPNTGHGGPESFRAVQVSFFVALLPRKSSAFASF